MDKNIYIPENKQGIPEGYYSINELINILRAENISDKGQFILDMLEE